MTMLSAALDLAMQGWRVLPCIPTGPKAKAPLLEHGFHDASADPKTITAWWARWPGALIGAAVPDTLLVLDVDPRNGGTLDNLQSVLGILPATLTVTSGRGEGGMHLYYLRPPCPLISTRLPEGIDLKTSGYCIMPPSPHPATGHPYRWWPRPPMALPELAVAAMLPAPPRLRPTSTRTTSSSAEGLVRVVAEAPEGRRNDLLYWAAKKAVDEGYDGHVLEEIEAAALGAGLTELETARTISSARRAGANV